MNPDRRLILAGLLAFSAKLSHAHPTSGSPASRITETLTVGGRVAHPLALAVGALRTFRVEQLADAAVKSRSGETVRWLTGYAGVRLTELLDKAELIAGDHNDLKKTIVVATASDDYKAVFSWSELYNTAVGEGVYVLIAREGRPLGDDEGRLALISLKDLHTGPRHVRWLKDVQVQKIA